MGFDLREIGISFACFVGASLVCYLYDRLVVGETAWKRNVDEDADPINVNRILFFGIQTRRCEMHSNGMRHCKDPECSYYPLSVMLSFLYSAKKSIDVCIYIMTAQVLADAIIDAKNRGLKIRIIADADSSFSSQSMIDQFRAKDMPVRQKMSCYIMHHKFIVIDNEIVLSGSMNFTMTGVLGNWENVIISSHPQLVRPYIGEFQTLWEEFAPGKLMDYPKRKGLSK